MKRNEKISCLSLSLIIHHILDIPYNQPIFARNASWNPNATTVADQNVVGSNPRSLFVDINNTLYVACQHLHQVKVWYEGNASPSRVLQGDLSFPQSVFATINGDIYVDNGGNRKRIDMWTLHTKQSISVMNVLGECYGLFIDHNDSIYCSLSDHHRVIRTAKHTRNQSIIIAGNGSAGSTSNTLTYPSGIFVDINFTFICCRLRQWASATLCIGRSEWNDNGGYGKFSIDSIAMSR